MSIDLSGLPDRVTLAVGQRRDIALPSHAGSGNAWSAETVDGEDFARVAVEVGESPYDPESPGGGTAPPPTTAYAPERAIIDGLAPGEATWRLILARSFGSGEPTATHMLHVTVVDAPERPEGIECAAAVRDT